MPNLTSGSLCVATGHRKLYYILMLLSALSVLCHFDFTAAYPDAGSHVERN
jgi:hypothetical protein